MGEKNSYFKLIVMNKKIFILGASSDIGCEVVKIFLKNKLGGCCTL